MTKRRSSTLIEHVDRLGGQSSLITASRADLRGHFVASVNVTDNESFSRVLSSLVTSWRKDEMAARAGIEPCIRFLEACAAAISSASATTADAQRRAQKFSSLTEVMFAGQKLPVEFRSAMRASQ
ncbi:MAG: hypothetical protein JNL92_21410 [Opitutaceae bacterium]|nr:hypothetical protein [Opitutaceae bacterium]